MKKTTQFISAAVLAVIGIVFMSVSRFSASADSLISYNQNFSVVLIIGLILMAAAAFWFYILSQKR